MNDRRNSRQEAIRKVIRTKQIRTQGQLVRELKFVGTDCTQATISRDIFDMNIRKLKDGVYVLPEDLHLEKMVSELSLCVERSSNFVIIKSQAGTAQGIAVAIDNAELPHVMGTIAGNDTLLVIVESEDEASNFVDHINKLRLDETLDEKGKKNGSRYDEAEFVSVEY